MEELKIDLAKEMYVLVCSIYQYNRDIINKLFIVFIDKLTNYIEQALEKENRVINIDEEIMELENAYFSGDYILTADIIQGKISQKL